MISMDFNRFSRDVADAAQGFKKLPMHIGKKHMLAAMRASIRGAGGVQKLRANTPPVGMRRGRKKKGEKRSTGELRRSVTTKAKWIGRNRDGVAVAGLGYKYGWNSRKAIWNEYGTKWQKGVAMMQRTFESIRQPIAARLASDMAAALEKAANEVAGGQNKGYGG